jgi:regulator of cell morphogenesis and NO signaling
MFLQPFEINRKSAVSDIVLQDFRTAEVFRKHGISYCCGAKWPMEMACEMHGVDVATLQKELEDAVRTVHLPNIVDYEKWDTGFLVEYIINIHHHYLKETLPKTQESVHEFIDEHVKKFPYLAELKKQFDQLVDELLKAVCSEEEVLFPYIRQLVHAHKHKEPYAAMFIRTLRKPVEQILHKSHSDISNIILSIRKLTNIYLVPPQACLSHQVVLSKLKELDNDLMQHFYLEKSILFPRAIRIEKEVLDIIK